jgi:hypothetical protein
MATLKNISLRLEAVSKNKKIPELQKWLTKESKEAATDFSLVLDENKMINPFLLRKLKKETVALLAKAPLLSRVAIWDGGFTRSVTRHVTRRKRQTRSKRRA